MKHSEPDQYSEQEAQQRFEKLVRFALNTRPKPLKSMGPKGDAVAIEETTEARQIKSLIVYAISDYNPGGPAAMGGV
jgi:hypothetical protein